jgi:hypothetical protein
MRFGDVEIPADIVDAHAAGRLVIFVGAGASMGPPSNLPSFSDLTKRVRDESELTDVIGDLANESLDEVMLCTPAEGHLYQTPSIARSPT